MDLSKYCWTPRHALSIEHFVKKYRPSVTESSDTEWISVVPETGGESEEKCNAQTKAIGKGQVIVNGLTQRITKIEGDASIPVRAKKGVKSKKALRDEAIAEAAEALKKLSLESGFTVGKWMFFPKNEHVDQIWSRIARSVAGGPLKDAGVKAAKVAPAQPGGEEYATHLICVHIDDIYDVEQVRKILTVLLTEHGIEPSAAKSDLYTILDIDSKHPSKMRSSLWRPSEVIDGGDSAVKALKAQYKPEKDKPGAYKSFGKPENEGEAGFAGGGPVDDAERAGEPAAHAGVKRGASGGAKEAEPTEQPRPAQQDLLAKSEQARPKEPKRPAKRIKSAARRFKEDDVFAGSDDEF